MLSNIRPIFLVLAFLTAFVSDTTAAQLNPSITVTLVGAGEMSGDISFDYLITDDDSLAVSLLVEFDVGNGWLPAVTTGNLTDILPPSYSGSIIWNSSTNAEGVDAFNANIRITPSNENGDGTLSASDKTMPLQNWVINIYLDDGGTVGEVDGGFRGSGFKNAFGNLWMRQEWELHASIVLGTAYRVTSQVLDIYDWRNRTVVKQEVTLWSDDDEVMLRGIHHQSYLLSQSSGKVKLRDPKSKEGVRKFEIPDGEPIQPVDRTIDLEMCGVFFHGNRNYHTDRQASVDIGFEEVVVGGKMTMSLIGDMLEKHFGDGFSKGGTLDIKFTNIVWPNDHITAKGVITSAADDNGSKRAHLDVWME
ncbi:MAG: MaoC family dehydratase, partial [Candidatus Marinimicrobia bacterium]|nr:MaoC family dehydratase [Candidatus Neomarinimicrobiota bacterium]